MKLLDIVCLFCFSMFVFWVDTADAANWRRAKGTLKVIYYEDSDGYFLDDLPESSRRLPIDQNLRSNSNSNNIKSSCRDNKRLRQRRCKSEYYYEIKGQGNCFYNNSTVLYNYTSKSRNIFVNLKSSILCPTGSIYIEAEGEVRRS